MFAGCGRWGFADVPDAQWSARDDGNDGSDDGGNDALIAPSLWAIAPAQPGVAADLWAAYAFSDTDRWVAGTSATVMHDEGSGWVAETNPAPSTLFGFWGAANDLWLVGRTCTALRWQGVSWSSVTVPGCNGNQDFFNVDRSATNNIWLIGTSGTIAQWNGAWQDHSQTNMDFWDAAVASATDVTVVGTAGTILHWNGSIFTAEPGAASVTLASITISAPGEYWVVGDAGTILKKVGAGGWTQVASPTAAFLYHVLALSTTDVWAVGSGGVIIHYDGSAWTQVASPTTSTLRGLAVIPGAGLCAVGNSGLVLVHP